MCFMMVKEKVFSEVKNILEDMGFEIDSENSSLSYDLGMDSTEMVDFSLSLNEKYKLNIDSIFLKNARISDVIKKIIEL